MLRGDDFGEALWRQIRLLHHRRRARINQRLRVCRLMVIDGLGEGHKQGGEANGGDFGDGQRAGAGNHPVGVRIGCRHVFNKGDDFGNNTCRFIRGAGLIQPALADLMYYLWPRIFRQQRQRLRHEFVQRLCPLRTAEDEQADGIQPPQKTLRRGGHGGEVGAVRSSGEHLHPPA